MPRVRYSDPLSLCGKITGLSRPQQKILHIFYFRQKNVECIGSEEPCTKKAAVALDQLSKKCGFPSVKRGENEAAGRIEGGNLDRKLQSNSSPPSSGRALTDLPVNGEVTLFPNAAGWKAVPRSKSRHRLLSRVSLEEPTYGWIIVSITKQLQPRTRISLVSPT
jgi:hypothetical protein